MSSGRVFVATETFAEVRKEPAERLLAAGLELRGNPTGRRLTRDDYATCLAGVDYVIAGLEPYDDAVFDAFPGVRVLSRIGIGLDSIDLPAARKHGVRVYSTPAAPSRSVAEQTVGFMIVLARGLARMDADFHAGRWVTHLGREIAEMTVGLVGFGRIGAMVAERLAGFGCRLVATDPAFDADKGRRLNVEPLPFAELLAASDIVSLHLPLQRDTRHLVGAKEIARMRAGAFLVNTSRGGVVDDVALVAALRSGTLGGAALDVFEREPDPTPYLDVPGLVASPHVGSNTVEGRYRMEIGAVDNLLAYIGATENGVVPPPGVEA